MKQINRIFLVDDDKVLNIVNSKMLRAAGYKNRITIFNSAQDALNEIEELVSSKHDELPQVIFLDIQMPGIDGWEFLMVFEKLILPLPEICKVYILSSSIDSISAIRAKSHKSVQGLIHKPLSKANIESLFGFAE